MKIERVIVNRTITESEFLSLKEDKTQPFATFRQDAKACFPGDTKVCVENEGWVELQKIIPAINLGLFTPEVRKEFKILTPKGTYESVLATFYGETLEWIEFDMDNGDMLRMTPNHICMVIRNGKKIKIRADEVLNTDKFIGFVPEKSPVFSG